MTATIPTEYSDIGVKAEPATGIPLIPLGLILDSPFQSRSAASRKDDRRLRESMAEHGQTVPAEVRPVREGPSRHLRFELLHGHRRFRILKERPSPQFLRATVRQVDDAEAARIVQAENQGRLDLTPLELARAALKLTRRAVTQEETGRILGRSQPNIANMLRVLKVIPRDVLALVDRGDLTFTALRPLLPMMAVDGHVHEEDIRRIVDRTQPHSEYTHGRLSLRPVRESDIQRTVKSRLSGSFTNSSGLPQIVRWRPMNAKAEGIYQGRTSQKRPSMDAYLSRAPGRIHDFGSLGLWACNDRAWKLASEAEARKAGGNGSGASKPAQAAAPAAAGAVMKKAATKAGRLQTAARKAGADVVVLAQIGRVEDLRKKRPLYRSDLPHDIWEGLGVGRHAREALRAGDSVYKLPDGQLGIRIAPFRRDMTDHMECTRGCLKGRRVAVTQPESTNYLGDGGRGKAQIIELCTNPQCAIAKLKAGHEFRLAEVEKQNDLERAAIEKAGERFPTLDRGVALLMLAVLVDVASVPPATREEAFRGDEDSFDCRVSLAEELMAQLSEHGDGAIVKEDLGFNRVRYSVDPETLERAMADVGDAQLSLMVFDFALRAVTDGRAGEYYEPRAGAFAALVGGLTIVDVDPAELKGGS